MFHKKMWGIPMAFAIYVFAVFVVVTVMLSSYFLGGRGRDRGRYFPYESGVKSLSPMPSRFFVHYFLIAISFVIFDLESVFLYVWASSIREVGWSGFFQMLFFIAMLLLALVYALHMGVLKSFGKSFHTEEESP